MERLPVNKLEPLLDLYGLQGTWARLLSAYVRQSRPDLVESILSDPWFDGVEPSIDSLLCGLSIGQQSVLYEFSLAYVNRESRKDEGQYFTPDDVAQFMVERCKGFDDGVWLDPCSGVGNLTYWLVDDQPDSETFLRDRMKLADRDSLALFIARVLLTVAFQKNDPDLFANIADNFKIADFLDDAIVQHDYVLVNPPYVGVPQDSRFKTVKARDTYAYFLERILYTSKGFVSITPQSFTNGGKFSVLRNLMRESGKGFDIYCFDNVPDSIFKGVKFGSKNSNKVNSTRAAVIVYGKTAGRRITPLLRWRSAERTQFLLSADNYLSELPEAELFPKVSAGLLGLYKQSSGVPRLGSVLSKTPTDYKLLVPSTPRYFIPAVKRELTRSSAKTIYFKNDEDLHRYYAYLNSSALYWWWRVNDGGMTLSLDTLLTLPLFNDPTEDPGLTLELENSESANLVVKVNAGKPNENVKHPVELLHKLNRHYFPNDYTELLKTHDNSVL